MAAKHALTTPPASYSENITGFEFIEFDRAYQDRGVIAGIDEAGRGPLAGPVVAAACIIPKEVIDSLPSFLSKVNDSKRLTRLQRKEVMSQLKEESRIAVGVGIVSHEVIDQINILQATLKAMILAVSNLSIIPNYLLVDGRDLPQVSIAGEPIPGEAVIKGDQRSLRIAAASIVAKETRDLLMEEMAHRYPRYGFEQHKGYGTEAHLEALAKEGPSPIHRRSFRRSKPR